MLIVIIPQPPLDSFDLCSKCVFNKSARGEGRKESNKRHKRRDELREQSRWKERR